VFRGPCEKAGEWNKSPSHAEVEREMKAIIVLSDPIWMMLVGATLLSLASAVRRFMPSH
jgi:hypothetical protein